MVSRLTVQMRRNHRVVWRDAYHEVQYGGGHWVLARGPLAHRMGGGLGFVGVEVHEAAGRGRLATHPRWTPRAEGLWTERGRPARGGLCMGDPRQYRRLASREFSPAEALVHWVDAGVIVATGRSQFHEVWREDRLGKRSLLRRRR
jgi:hypothetical protein